MALKIRIELTAKCRKHPRFDPAKDGVAAIRGGCETCFALVKLKFDADGISTDLVSRADAIGKARP